ncbi:hypothetical protein [Tepidibacter sp. Z1-5]|uniref:hypothetical protein n=1 Tax=Tepidibacter sp. Z1-5 TaxID=3134138 RepID=UPI0030BA7340
MGGSLIIAKYKDSIIGVNDYIESVHGEEYLICPFCEDLGKILRVNYNKRGYFVAWKGMDGHICGRGCLTYLNSDWEGAQLVEVVSNENGEKEVVIDIFTGFNKGVKKITKPSADCTDEVVKRKYKQYARKKKVFRDVIRTVKQMRQILEKNEITTLKNLNFKYRVGSDEKLSIDELLKMPNSIENKNIGKYRFVLFKAKSASKLKKGNKRRYLNAYTANGIDLAVTYDVVENENPFSGLNGEFALAYGRISKDKNNTNKYYLNLSSDFHIEKVDKEFGQLFFEDVELSAFDFKQYYKEKKEQESTKKIETREVQDRHLDHDKIRTMNNKGVHNKEVQKQNESNQTSKIQPSNTNRDEENIEFRTDNSKTYNNEESSNKSNQKTVGIKGFLKKLFRMS